MSQTIKDALHAESEHCCNQCAYLLGEVVKLTLRVESFELLLGTVVRLVRAISLDLGKETQTAIAGDSIGVV